MSNSNKNFRHRLLNGDTLLGTLVTLPLPQVTELLGLAGFDWLFLDGEHAPLTPPVVQTMLQGAGETPCLVRVAEKTGPAIRAALDAGATGIIAPLVNSAEEAQQVVDLCRYPPDGKRSVGVGRAHGYGLRFGDYMTRANAESTVVIQVEHIDAVADIDAIVWIEGIDAIFVGPYDLSSSMGKPGRVDDPEVRAAIERVRNVCREAGKPLGIFGMTPEAVEPYRRQGFTLLTVGMDTVFLGQAARAARKRIGS